MEFLKNKLNIEPIESFESLRKNENMEIFKASIKILIQKIKIENENEFEIEKNIILSKGKKIYDIIEDHDKQNPHLYLIYNGSENIDELFNTNFYKSNESVMKDKCGPISLKEINGLFKKEDAMCKIKTFNDVTHAEECGSGFFLKLDDEQIPFKKCLITNNHVLPKKKS